MYSQRSKRVALEAMSFSVARPESLAEQMFPVDYCTGYLTGNGEGESDGTTSRVPTSSGVERSGALLRELLAEVSNIIDAARHHGDGKDRDEDLGDCAESVVSSLSGMRR